MKSLILLITLFVVFSNLYATDTTTVKAKSTEISDNLDLEAVATLFGEAKNIEEFEKKLNDPKTQVSNLDLNKDGQVDYLRIIETSKDNTRTVTLQAVIGKDKHQDVATINVKKSKEGKTEVQVVGDTKIYGSDYVIVPVYTTPPVIYVYFYTPYYHPYRSPYYYGYYPVYYHPWHPYPTHRYRANVRINVNIGGNSYRRRGRRNTNVNVNKNKKNNRAVKNDWVAPSKRNGENNKFNNNKKNKKKNNKKNNKLDKSRNNNLKSSSGRKSSKPNRGSRAGNKKRR